MSALNVVLLNPETVTDQIQTYLEKIEKKSPNTRQAYERDIRMFFKVVKNKNIEELDDRDITINFSTLVKYQNYLLDSGKYKNSSITRMIASVESLYAYLKACERDVNPYIFKHLDTLKDDTKNIGVISPDEAKMLAKLALLEKHSGLEKQVIILLAASTSMRKNAIFEIKFSDIAKHPTKLNTYIINREDLFDKGGQVYKEIHEVLYKKIMSLKGDKSDNDCIFSISPNGINDVIKRLCKKAGYDPIKRNLTFHSLRKAGVALVDELTNGDIIAITAQGNWSSTEVAYKSYIDKQRKVNMAGIEMFETIDEDLFDELTRDELVRLVKSFGNGLGQLLKRKAKEIVLERGGE